MSIQILKAGTSRETNILHHSPALAPHLKEKASQVFCFHGERATSRAKAEAKMQEAKNHSESILISCP
ncbi:MAG TPA: hypothetical protein VMY43_00950 [Methanothrix sp.]|nr:hypothetical protein [Methanothrix sp.]